jgi:glycosyltransferase involved in cell wall biosynthesis
MMMDPNFQPVEVLSGVPLLKTEVKLVAILLATYNGVKFLAEQLDSIERQTHTNWHVYASDDGSSDDTISILESYRERWGNEKLRISQGPQRGHAANFLSLVRDECIKADYYAFCDQDDVWIEDKLERSINAVGIIGETKPALYGSRTTLIDKNGCAIGFSPLFSREPSLKNALVQSLFGGNTMLLNNATRDCLCLIPYEQEVISHDWLSYLLVCACDGEVYYDAVPSLLYRQHGDNAIGSNNSFSDRVVRLKWLFKGRFKAYSENNLAILACLHAILPNKNAEIVELFRDMRVQPFFIRIHMFKKIGLYRQTKFGTIGLWVALITNKI